MDLLVRVRAAGVNPLDVKTRDGALKMLLKSRSELSIRDTEPPTHVPRMLELVQHRDGIVLEGDEAPSLLVDE